MKHLLVAVIAIAFLSTAVFAQVRDNKQYSRKTTSYQKSTDNKKVSRNYSDKTISIAEKKAA